MTPSIQHSSWLFCKLYIHMQPLKSLHPPVSCLKGIQALSVLPKCLLTIKTCLKKKSVGVETAIEKENPSQISLFLSYCHDKDNRQWYILYYLSLSPSMNFSQESSLAIMKKKKKDVFIEIPRLKSLL